jgi:hypothetical protein
MPEGSSIKILKLKRLVFTVFLLAAAAGGFLGGVFLMKNGQEASMGEESRTKQAAFVEKPGKSFIQSVAGAFSKTFADLFGSAGEPNPVLEIEAGAPAALPQGATGGGEANSGSEAEGFREKLAKSARKTAGNTDAPAVALEICQFFKGDTPTRSVILNEIAWMGSPPAQGQSASEASRAEWIELKNVSGKPVALSGWQVASEDGGFRIRFGSRESMEPDGLQVLRRGSEYESALSNGGERLKLFDNVCLAVDEVDASSGWPAGDNADKYTMERDASTLDWYTSSVAGGTPEKNNSPRPAVAQSTTAQAQAISDRNVSGETADAAKRYRLRVEKKGNGGGIVVAHRGELHCGTKCSDEYARGTEVFLTPVPASNSSFSSWSGACGGGGDVCRLVVEKNTSVTATFSLLPKSSYTYVPPPPENAPPPAFASSATPVAGSSSALHLVIREVQITGGTGKTDNDFIKIYNPTGSAVDVGGWKLRKRTQTGSESSVKVFPDGSVIPAQGYFIWANSKDGFSESISADASSTQTLAADNSIAFFDAEGNVIDALAWGEGHVGPFVEDQPYPQNPGASQVAARKAENGLVVDTDNNAQDFELR